jgi:hypothetical protein
MAERFTRTKKQGRPVPQEELERVKASIALELRRIVVAILSGLINGIASIFGAQLYAQPSWLPVLGVPWWICFGTIVTFVVAILFQTGRKREPQLKLTFDTLHRG